jgi:hypothetical protein
MSRGRRVKLVRNELVGSRLYTWSENGKARGFPYSPVANGTASVTGGRTAAGLSALLVCAARLRGSPGQTASALARTEAAIRDALAWFQRYFSHCTDPREAKVGKTTNVRDKGELQRWYTSYLHGLEVAASFAGFTRIGARDWYLECAQFLLERPVPAARSTVDTSFELLFLCRSGKLMNRLSAEPKPTIGSGK